MLYEAQPTADEIVVPYPVLEPIYPKPSPRRSVPQVVSSKHQFKHQWQNQKAAPQPISILDLADSIGQVAEEA